MSTLPRVLLIGGAPMSGKSSVAKVLARRHDRTLIATDDVGIAIRAALHGERARIPENHHEYYLSRSADELWHQELARLRSLAAPIAALARAHAQPWSTPAIIEGWAVLPPESAPPERDIERVWLLATPQLLEARTLADEMFWSGARDEAEMRRKFVARSLLLNDHLRAAARTLPLRLIDVGGGDSPEALADRIEELLQVVAIERV